MFVLFRREGGSFLLLFFEGRREDFFLLLYFLKVTAQLKLEGGRSFFLFFFEGNGWGMMGEGWDWREGGAHDFGTRRAKNPNQDS